jgi:ribonuclease P protein component
MKPNSFPKEEKLKNKKHISLLFDKGKWFSHGELRIIYLPFENIEGVEKQKVGVSVSKRYFKKATDRNQIKRWLREAYRLNKALFIETFGEQSLAMIFFVSKKKPSHFSEVETTWIQLCQNFKKN